MEIYRVSVINAEIPIPITLFTWLQVQSQKSGLPFDVYTTAFFTIAMEMMKIPVVPAKAGQLQ